MKTFSSLSVLLCTLALAITTGSCAHRPVTQKIGDEHINVPPVSKASEEALGNPHPSLLKPTIDPKKCTCVQLWMPVCGENGKTYSNACFADCAGVKYKQGSCQKDAQDYDSRSIFSRTDFAARWAKVKPFLYRPLITNNV